VTHRRRSAATTHGNIDYVKLLEDEHKRFKRSAPGFQSSSIGMTVGDALKLAGDLAVRQAGELAVKSSGPLAGGNVLGSTKCARVPP
jgi:hypothetical protein